jgi:hypothetical protein
MPDRWALRGTEFGNCNCAWGCPCQFNAPSTHGNCQAVVGGEIEQGNFNDTRLDGLRWALVLKWPGEIAEGNGQMQAIIDERASAPQREALRKILHGESTAPGATHFFVYHSTMSKVFAPLFAPIELEIDVPGRRGRLRVPNVVESDGMPIVDARGNEHQAEIRLPNGFEYTVAQMGSGRARAHGAIELAHEGSYGQFNLLHMNQDGVIR